MDLLPRPDSPSSGGAISQPPSQYFSWGHFLVGTGERKGGRRGSFGFLVTLHSSMAFYLLYGFKGSEAGPGVAIWSTHTVTKGPAIQHVHSPLGWKGEAGVYSAHSSIKVHSDSLIPIKSFLLPILKQLPSLTSKVAVTKDKSRKEVGRVLLVPALKLKSCGTFK